MTDRPATVTWGIAFGQTHVLADLVAGVELAERSGYDYFWYGNEKLHPDMWVGLSMAALHSRSLRVGTFVADPYSQHPAVTAAMIATLDHYSAGRAVLVMGAGGSGLRELGMERRRPVEAVGKALGIIRQILAGELATSDGPPFPVEARLHFPPRPDIPLWIATRGTAMLELAGRVADGVMIGTIARASDIRGALEVVAKGAAGAGRDPASLTASVRVDVSVADDAAEARAVVRSFVAGVLSASYPDRGFVERAGLTVPAELEEICRRTGYLRLAWASAELVPDEIVDAFTWAGTPADVAARVAEAIEVGIDNVTVVFHGAGGSQLAQARRFNLEVLPALDALAGADGDWSQRVTGRLEGKVALVTGAASGIGRAIARRFAAEGAAVSVLDRDGEGLEETVVGIDADVARHTGDVTDAATVRSVVGSIVAVHGRLDVLSHCAGVDQPVRSALDTDDELWSRVMAVNAGGTFVVDREAIRAMLAGDGGSVVNTVSDLGYVAVGGLAAYCASKGAALQLTRVLAAEYAPRVRVNALCPTMVDTPMARRSLSSRPDPDAYLKEIEAEIPMGRIAQVDDITGAAVFLASDESRYVTGIALPIDGGRTIS